MSDEAAIKEAALVYLARREHSYFELSQKLSNKFDSITLISAQLDRLVEVNLLDDQRFTQMFVRHKILAGKGPFAIRQLLVAKGIQSDLIEESLIQPDHFWLNQAEAVYQKKYKNIVANDYQEKNKRMRFLLSRGYSGAIAKSVVL